MFRLASFDVPPRNPETGSIRMGGHENWRTSQHLAQRDDKLMDASRAGSKDDVSTEAGQCANCKGLIAELPHKNSQHQIGPASHGNVTSSLRDSTVATVRVSQARGSRPMRTGRYRPGGGSYTSSFPRLQYEKNYLGYFISSSLDSTTSEEASRIKPMRII